MDRVLLTSPGSPERRSLLPHPPICELIGVAHLHPGLQKSICWVCAPGFCKGFVGTGRVCRCGEHPTDSAPSTQAAGNPFLGVSAPLLCGHQPGEAWWSLPALSMALCPREASVGLFIRFFSSLVVMTWVPESWSATTLRGRRLVRCKLV